MGCVGIASAFLRKYRSKSSVGDPGGVYSSKLNEEGTDVSMFSNATSSSSSSSSRLVGEFWMR